MNLGSLLLGTVGGLSPILSSLCLNEFANGDIVNGNIVSCLLHQLIIHVNKLFCLIARTRGRWRRSTHYSKTHSSTPQQTCGPKSADLPGTQRPR